MIMKIHRWNECDDGYEEDDENDNKDDDKDELYYHYEHQISSISSSY
jgi:hypothetical protein